MEYLLQDLRHCPKYSRQELIDLGRQYQEQGDVFAREQMILGILPLAVKVAQKHFAAGQACGLTNQELVSMAMEGAIRAVDKFDPQRGIALTTYAVKVMKSQIYFGLGQGGGVIKLPHDRNSAAPARQVHIARIMQGVQSIDETFSDESGDGTLAEILPDRGDDFAELEESQERRRRCAWVRRAVERLPEREQEVVLARMRGEKLSEIGDKLGVTRERVRQIETLARERLKDILLDIEKERPMFDEKDNHESPAKTRVALIDMFNSITAKDLDEAAAVIEQEFQVAKQVYTSRMAKIKGLRKALGGKVIRCSPTKLLARGSPTKLLARERVFALLLSRGACKTADIIVGADVPRSSVSPVLNNDTRFVKVSYGVWDLTPRARAEAAA